MNPFQMIFSGLIDSIQEEEEAALNKLIEKDNLNSDKPNNECLIDWDKYKNKLIIQTNGELSISNLSKVDDFSVFFN